MVSAIRRGGSEGGREGGAGRDVPSSDSLSVMGVERYVPITVSTQRLPSPVVLAALLGACVLALRVFDFGRWLPLLLLLLLAPPAAAAAAARAVVLE